MRLTKLAISAVALTVAVYGGQAMAQAKVSFPDRTCSVVDYGAEGSAIWAQLTHYDTAAFQAAIDDCSAKGGGTVEVPKGEWMIGALWLKSNVRLNIQKGAEVLGGTDPALYGGDDIDGERVGIINIKDAENVAITGEGTIDGQGQVWWERMRAIWRSDARFATDGQARQTFKETRPRLVVASGSRNVLFEGVKLINSPSFHLVLVDSEYLTVNRVEIRSPAHGPNTDAIDPTQSRHVLISNNIISVGDDAVAIKASRIDPKYPNAISSDIIIRGNHILAGRGICIGSGTKGGVTRILVEDNVFSGSMYGFRIKTARDRGGLISDVTFHNNTMTDVEVPLVFSSYYAYRPMDVREAQKQVQPTGFILGNQIWPAETDPAQKVDPNLTPHMKNIVVDGLTATGADRIGIAVGLPEQAIDGLTLRNVHIEAKTGLLVRHAALRTENTTLTVSEGPAYVQQKGAVVKTR